LALVVRRRPVVALATEVLSAGGTPQGAAGTEIVGAGVFGSVAPSDAALAPGSSGFMSPGLLEPYLPNSPSFAPPPIN
jgi:hypothetical protein